MSEFTPSAAGSATPQPTVVPPTECPAVERAQSLPSDQIAQCASSNQSVREHVPAPSVGDLVIIKNSPLNAEAPDSAMCTDLTPAQSFFVRSNFPAPTLDPETHRITVGGAVRHTFDLSMAELRSMPSRTMRSTIECAGNDRIYMAPLPHGEPWRRGAVSTAKWTGVPLRDVLELAGLAGDVCEILAEGADSGTKDRLGVIPFARALPVAEAMRVETLLAFEMNGAPLPPDHGAPLRLMVPGWYGMASVKWIARIEALTEPFDGYFQTVRYVYDRGDGNAAVPVTRMLVKSMITSPVDGDIIPQGRIAVRGWAWSGYGDIVRVEVAAGGGEEWREAKLLDPSSPYAWWAWELDWNADEPGRHTLRCRAMDAAGNVQPECAQWNRLGYANNSVRPVTVRVL